MSKDPGIKILLVDDNENNLMSMEVVLENEGYVFSKATSGREALRDIIKRRGFFADTAGCKNADHGWL
jgi:CheY-like chemotaxis protein